MTVKLVVNKLSQVVHKPECRCVQRISAHNLEITNDPSIADAPGYQWCGNCSKVEYGMQYVARRTALAARLRDLRVKAETEKSALERTKRAEAAGGPRKGFVAMQKEVRKLMRRVAELEDDSAATEELEERVSKLERGLNTLAEAFEKERKSTMKRRDDLHNDLKTLAIIVQHLDKAVTNGDGDAVKSEYLESYMKEESGRLSRLEVAVAAISNRLREAEVPRRRLPWPLRYFFRE